MSEIGAVFRDAEQMARANRTHASLQNRLAHLLRTSGIIPLSPHSTGPNFDIAWQMGQIVYVAEVKSLTPDNEESQLRLGLGQVLMYRYLLAQRYATVRAILAVEHEPANPSWPKLCEELEVILLWPDVMEATLQSYHALTEHSPD